jgi:hypothetical protein
MVWDSSRIARPPRWMRILGVVLAVIFALPLIGAHQPLDIVKTVVLCGIWVFLAISPRAIYDGRAGAWEQAHPVLAAVTLFLFIGLLMFNALTYFLSPLVSVLISVGFSAVFAPWGIWQSRKRNRSRRSTE